jgi:serine/threonine protein phosphatase PrpC
VSRSFGDYNLKKFIISDPDVSKYEITDTDRYIVMASDGFWDVNCLSIFLGTF